MQTLLSHARPGCVCVGLSIAVAACGGSPVQPSPISTAASIAEVRTSDPRSVEAIAPPFGLTPGELMARGWSCRLTPAGTTACSPPGRGLPVFGAPDDRPPSYLVHVFDTATSEYLGFGRMIRTDLYQGQVCPSTGAAYTPLPHIGYYECFNPVS